jgi:hypothetical protein
MRGAQQLSESQKWDKNREPEDAEFTYRTRIRRSWVRVGAGKEETVDCQIEDPIQNRLRSSGCIGPTREARRARAAERLAELDERYVVRFAKQVRELYPGGPQGRETQIAEHACCKYSGRVGRSAAAKELDEQAVRLAVIAHVRHPETEYD